MQNNPQLYPKAYFNWIVLKWKHNPSFQIEPWQVEDYRQLSLKTIFERLSSLGLKWTEEKFLLMADAALTPEELTHNAWPDKENEMPIYLLLFELWRRLLPKKGSLSIFCDELDNQIRLYLQDPSQDYGISDSLQKLQELLEESTDLGENPRAIFATLSRHVAHDLEGFLFDYLSDQIDARNDLEAAELIRVFYPYVKDVSCFDFLKARLLVLMDPHEGNVALKKLLEKVTDLDLLLEVAAFLIHHGDPSLFQKAAKLCFAEIQTEEDFQELLAIVADYSHFIEKDKNEEQIQAVFAKRLNLPPTIPVAATDPDVIFLRNLLDDPEWTKI